MSTPSVKESRRGKRADAAEELVASESESSFDAATFFEKFEVLADTPNSIESLRGVIRNLAVDGRLEPSSSDAKAIKLEQLAIKINSGATPKGGRNAYVESGIPLIRSMNVHFHGFVKDGLVFLTDQQADSLSNAVVETDDVLLNITGASIGRVSVAPTEMNGARVNQHVTIIRPKKVLFPAYLALFLASPKTQQFIDSIQVGATRQALTKGMIQNFKIPVPPLAEQKRIVGKVDELMGLCDRLEALEAERKERHASLSRAALARFADSPTPTNLQLLFHNSFDVEPSELRQTILSAAVRGMVVSQTGIDDPLYATSDEGTLGFSIPQNWRWKTISSIVVDGPTNGFSPKAVDYETPFKTLTLAATTSGQFRGEHFKYISNEIDHESNLWLRDGDMLVQRGNSIEYVGVPAVYRGGSHVFIYPDLMMRMRFGPELDVDFLHIAMSERTARDYLRNRASGTSGSMPKINQTSLKSLPLPIPPLVEQKRIVAKVDELMALVDQLEQQLANSRTLGQQLLEAVVANLTANHG
ncbi:restriction endonuclease subunit S [Stieleria varia]|uniref:Type-1 restriction enzyme EcoKI specificity protein n=1 Tax=Stieleria varia TaxID=2528005 RepID=A0A5C6AZ16_9BACT|nr:restriction endonuclease subunit S [Stieleria varia]TWU04918.1 Type-1 restriction enzyme EcoKI specificity protein [Stieleria varia]